MNFDLGETDEQGKDRKMIKPPQVDHNDWVLLKDPKSKKAQQIPLLLKSQVRKIQRRYTACHEKTTSTDKKQVLRVENVKPIKVMKPNPRFNKEKAEEDKKPQTPQKFKNEKKSKDALIDVAKKLFSDEEGGFESFELAIKEEEMS